MKSDIIADLLERWYEEGRKDFHAFIESYSYSKSDEPVEELILQLYNFSRSNPWPTQWLDEKLKSFEVETLEEMEERDWMRNLLNQVEILLEDLLEINQQAIDICNGPGGPKAYLPALISDRDMINNMKSVSGYEEYFKAFSNVSFARLSGKREKDVLPELKEQVKSLRDEMKKAIKDLEKQYFFQSPKEMFDDMKEVKAVIQVLIELTKEFAQDFAKKKEEKNLVDFSDLEHFALKILVKDDGEHKVPTEAAMEVREQFDQIMIDEYQDSNLVQETILTIISKEDEENLIDLWLEMLSRAFISSVLLCQRYFWTSMKSMEQVIRMGLEKLISFRGLIWIRISVAEKLFLIVSMKFFIR